MSQIVLVIVLLTLEIVVAYFFGTKLHASNPDGIWLFTQAADGSGQASDSFYTGASIGLILMSLSYLAVSASIYSWAKLKSVTLSSTFVPLITSSIIGFIAIAVVAKTVL